MKKPYASMARMGSKDLSAILFFLHTGSETMKTFAPSLDPNKKLPKSVNKKIWLEFEEFDKGNPVIELTSFKCVEEVTRSIEHDHPIVIDLGNFAVAAFNKACEMHIKKIEHNNLHDFEFMECKYLKISKAYYFYITIEAIEEGNLGVYETQVVCTSDGSRRTLTKFFLTDRKPVGTKAMAISHFSCLRSLCKALNGVTDGKLCKLDKIFDSFPKGCCTAREDRGTAFHQLSFLSQLHREVIKVLQRELSLGLNLLFSQNCNRTTNPDVWTLPDNNLYA